MYIAKLFTPRVHRVPRLSRIFTIFELRIISTRYSGLLSGIWEQRDTSSRRNLVVYRFFLFLWKIEYDACNFTGGRATRISAIEIDCFVSFNDRRDNSPGILSSVHRFLRGHGRKRIPGSIRRSTFIYSFDATIVCNVYRFLPRVPIVRCLFCTNGTSPLMRNKNRSLSPPSLANISTKA